MITPPHQVNGASAEAEAPRRQTTRHRAAAALDVLRLPQALWVGIALAVAGGIWTWYQESQEADKRAAVMEARAESDRAAWQARAEQLGRDLEIVRASLRERIDDRGAAAAAAQQRLSASLAKVAAKLDRVAELLTRSAPEVEALKELPGRVRRIEAGLEVVRWRLDNARPGQGIPAAPK